MKYTTKNDLWGIRKTAREIFDKYKPITNKEYESAFDSFYNQFIPTPYKESRKTLLRHITELKNILRNSYFKMDHVWFARGKQTPSYARVTNQLIDEIKRKTIRLPTYQEIEEAKEQWQQKPTYNKEQGFSKPLEEEYIQIRIHK